MTPVDQAAELLGAMVRRDVSLAPLCTYRVGGPAKLFVEVADAAALEVVAAAVAATGLPTLVVGNGSNLLVADRGFDGLALRLGDGFGSIVVDDEPSDATEGGTARPSVHAGGAVMLPVLARKSVAAGYDNLAWAVGVPGTVGGAVRMNAGGHGSDVAADLRYAEVVDLATGSFRSADADDLNLGYRRSNLGPSEVVIGAHFWLTASGADGAAELSEIVAWRRANQPGGANAGSVFANPPGDSAGRLIEAAGLKGFRMGSAEVSTKHANFIQADQGGSADDVAHLIRHLQHRIRQDFGVELRAENRLVGFNEEAS